MSEWIEWNGGDCPVAGGVKVDIQFRDGEVHAWENPKHWLWTNDQGDGTIIAYRICDAKEQDANAISGPYEQLRAILDDAYDQSANGKGKERHANDLPWHEQPIIAISHLVGDGGAAFQAIKKITEAQGMAKRGEREAAYRECLGAIVYAAALAKLLRDGQ